MRIGRNRSRHASSVAVDARRPSSRCALANSTIRIAFLQARPISTTKPTCVKMLMSMLGDGHADHARQQAHRHDQDDRQRQRPAFVLRRQHQEDEHHREAEDEHAGVTGEQFEVGDLRPLERHRRGDSQAGESLSKTTRIISPVLTPPVELPLMPRRDTCLARQRPTRHRTRRTGTTAPRGSRAALVCAP